MNRKGRKDIMQRTQRTELQRFNFAYFATS